MTNQQPVLISAPLRYLSAALLKPFGRTSCSFCRRKIVGLPYHQAETRFRYCNSHCFCSHKRYKRMQNPRIQ